MSLLVDQSGRSDGYDYAAGELERSPAPLTSVGCRIGAMLASAAVAVLVIGWAVAWWR